MIKFSSDWEEADVAKDWPFGSKVLIHRPDRKSSRFGWLEVCQYFRPDWVEEGHYYNQGDRTLFMLLRETE